MKKLFPLLQLLGALMLVIGFTGPFWMGRKIPPLGYNILQIGGIALLVIGWIGKQVGKRKT